MLEPLFRKSASKSPLPEEEISEDLLANVPELDGNGDAGPFAGFARPDAATTPFTLVEEEPAAVDTVVSAAPVFTPPPYAAAQEPPLITPMPFPLGESAPPVPAPPVDPDALALDVHGLVDHARTLMEGAFQQELTRVEGSVGTLLSQMEARLAQAELELAAVKAEHDKVKAETERKAEALRDLKRALADI